jgi:uncharacterized protein
VPVTVNLHQLARHTLNLKGELDIADLDLGQPDEMVAPRSPLKYELEVEQLEQAVLAQGRLVLKLDCHCVRCLKPFVYRLEVEGWACHLPLEGEDAVPISNDSVDLTPHIREDILLALPQHPVCKPECGGLAVAPRGKSGKTADSTKNVPSAAWDELNKLKL